MTQMRLHVILMSSILLLFSCNDDSVSNENTAYFGGEIINPSNKYVTLSTSTEKKDTIFLDQNNRFLHRIDSLKPGLYSFEHGGEYQTILLEPKDSLLFRLNTNDFDESLVYTGIGSKKNNFFIKSFLDNEVENKDFMNTSHFEPEVFMKHMNKLKIKKLEYLDEFLSKKPSSELFKTLAKSTIDYNYYTYHEMFPFGYYGNKQLIHFKDLPEGFYDYRNDIDLNNESLTKLYVYNRFLFWYFNNLALKKYYSNGQHDIFDRMSLDYNIEKLRLIDSSITNKTIKNYLLKHNVTDFVLNSQDKSATIEMINYYLSKSTDDDDKIYLRKLVERANKLKPGNKLPNARLVDYNGNELEIHSLIKAPTVIYCWSTNFKLHSRNNHYKIKELKSKFPDVNFVAINFNDNDLKYWKKTVRSLNYPSKDEYKFSSPSEALDTYVITYTHKIFLVDKNGEIVSSNVSLFDDEIVEQLAALSKQ